MRKLLFATLITLTFFSSCSKSGTNPKTASTPTVTINGTAYPTTVIGKLTWTARNYSSSDDTVSFKGSKFYTLAQAQAIPLPTGWRLPTQSDFNSLIIATGGATDYLGQYINGNPLTLMADTSWSVGGGTNSLGFDAIAYGCAVTDPFSYSGYQEAAVFWCAQPDSTGNSQALHIYQINGQPRSAFPPTVELNYFNANYYVSVRFVKNN